MSKRTSCMTMDPATGTASTAQRILCFDDEVAIHDTAMKHLIDEAAPRLVAEPGIGHVTAAMSYNAWSHPGRCNEATFRSPAFLAAHVFMLILMGGLIAHYQPDPNGFRLSHIDVLAWFAVLTLPPLVIGMIARSGIAVGLIASGHALSPLSLVGAMRDDDLDLALILWWIPLPGLAGVVVIADWLHRSRRRA